MAERYLKRPNKPQRKFFFINKRLHKILKINRPANLVEAWSFEDNEKVTLLYSEYLQKHKRAAGVSEVAKMLNLHKDTIKRSIKSGNIHTPPRSYAIGSMKKDAVRSNPYWFSLENVLELWEYLMSVHQGRPRYDGEITQNQRLPTRAELIARFSDEVVLFSKADAAHYVPMYQPPKF